MAEKKGSDSDDRKEMSVREAGKKGGDTVRDRYGSTFYEEIGRKGGKATREIPATVMAQSKTHLEAWDRRTQMGPVGPAMGANFKRLGEQRTILPNWTERIAKGEAPKVAPPAAVCNSQAPRGMRRTYCVMARAVAGLTKNAAACSSGMSDGTGTA